MANHDTFYKTFSGSDSLAYAVFKDSKPVLLGNITTVSYSMIREKRPIPTIGRINPAAYTRGMRTVAGSLIFTTINQHFVKDLIQNVPYLTKYKKLKADELPLFDIMVISANEYGASAQLRIYGVDIAEEGQIITTENLFMENSFSFLARDIDEFSQFNPYNNGNGRSNPNDSLITSISTLEDFPIISSNTLNNDEIKEVQRGLQSMSYLNAVTGVIDNETYDAIKRYQSDNGMSSNGSLSEAVVSSILDKSKNGFSITNTSGAYLYLDSKLEEILGICKYGENLVGEINGDLVKTRYNGFDVYVEIENTSLKDVK